MQFFLALSLLLLPLASQALSIGTYNIRNFDYDVRYRIETNKPALATVIKNLNVDVLSVEEINNTRAWGDFVAKALPGYATELTRCGGEHGQHLGFVYNTRTIEMIGFTEDLTISNPGGPGTCDSGSRPLAIAQFKVKATGQKFFGMTAHLKSGSNASSLQKRGLQYKIIQKTIADLKARTGVKDFYVAGDFNTTEYLSRGADYSQLNQVVSQLGMIDLAAKLPCSAYWWGGTDDGIETPSLLDHVIVTPGLMKRRTSAMVHSHCSQVRCQQVPIKQLGISYESVSDHCPVTATLQ